MFRDKINTNASCPICEKRGLVLVHEKSLNVSGITEIHSNESYGHYVLAGKDVLIRFGPAEDVGELLDKMHVQ